MNKVLSVLGNVLLLLYTILEYLVLLCVPKRLRFKKIDQDIALVTGGGSGIGRYVALLLAKHGAKIVVWDLNQVGNLETRRLIIDNGGQCFSYICDVSNSKEVYEVAARVKREVGKVTILVNNAGIVVGKKLLELSDEKIEKVMSVNSLAHFWTCKAFLPDMMTENRGHVVTIASAAGLMGVNKLTDYCASKYAAVGFSESLTLELRDGGFDGIHVTVVCPFVVDTGLFKGFNPGILPILKQEEVAGEIVTAILINQRLLILPRALYAVLLLKNILPIESLFPLADIFDSGKMMTDFKGGRPKIHRVSFQNGFKEETGNNDEHRKEQ